MSNLKDLVAAELAKYEDAPKDEIKPESSVDEDTSELVSEDIKEEQEVGNDSPEVVNTESEDPYLKEAIEMGYDPNHKGPNRKTPEQFVRDGSFFKKIDAQKKEISELKTLVKQQIEHTKKVEKAAAERKALEARLEKEKMIQDGDLDGFRLAEAKEHAANVVIQQHQPAAPEPEQVSEDLREFINRNSTWCNYTTPENKSMAEDADLVITRTAQRNPGKSEKEVLEIAEETIKKLYPHRFENPNTNKPMAVGRSAPRSEKPKISLTQRQQDYFKMAQRHGSTLTLEEYAQQLRLIGELRND